jgi:hypothetical protein
MKLKRITKWSETSPGDVWISIYIKEYSLISERVGNLQEHIACSWPIVVADTILASHGTIYPYLPINWGFPGNWEFYLIDYKDLVLYTHWPYKSKRFWELLERV